MTFKAIVKSPPPDHGRGCHLYPAVCEECGAAINVGDTFYSRKHKRPKYRALRKPKKNDQG